MNTSFYILCLLVLGEAVISALIYDMVARRYRQLEKRMEKQWHIRMHRESIMQQIILLQRADANISARCKDDPSRADIKNQIKQLNDDLKATEHGKITE